MGQAKRVRRMASTSLNGFERVTHHGDEHVGQDDDDGDVVEREQEQSDALDHRRGVTAAREHRVVLAVHGLVRILDLDVGDLHESEHRPEQAVQSPRQPVTKDAHARDVTPAGPPAARRTARNIPPVQARV